MEYIEWTFCMEDYHKQFLIQILPFFSDNNNYYYNKDKGFNTVVYLEIFCVNAIHLKHNNSGNTLILIFKGVKIRFSLDFFYNIATTKYVLKLDTHLRIFLII